MAKTINCVELLAVAQAAYRTNGNQLLREPKDGLVPNGTLVKEFVYRNKPTVEVTEEDRTQARAMRDYINQRIMLSKLTGRTLSDFIVKLGVIISEDKVGIVNAGLAAWAPKVYSDLLKTDEAQQEFSLLGISSGYIGSLGDKVELEFYTITRRWTKHYGCFRYTGHDGQGNLIGFLSKNEYPKYVKLKARVKAHETGRLTQGKTTYLNYTKAV
jgi:hypothetical protein